MYAERNAAVDQAGDDIGYYDPKFAAHALKVLPGGYRVSTRDLMLVTVLGSCVAACLRDPLAGVGGMNHFMLPDGDGRGDSARYGGYAMEVLINELLKRGAARPRLEAKLFGGGAVLPGMTHNNIGASNARFALAYLAAEGIPVLAQDLYDTCPRRVHYFPLSGRTLVKRLPSAHRDDVLLRERQYRAQLAQAPAAGSVELF